MAWPTIPSFVLLLSKEMLLLFASTHSLQVKGSTLRPLFFGLSISEWF
ncbi:hypothetical protein GLYMA_17G076950v4 [Glycine max]|nr:hypothetical protein GLYMA_17G076950v4 [Glycine max]KAH1117343.1 hypothetical protein GYH30_046576 [Glycine max]